MTGEHSQNQGAGFQPRALLPECIWPEQCPSGICWPQRGAAGTDRPELRRWVAADQEQSPDERCYLTTWPAEQG